MFPKRMNKFILELISTPNSLLICLNNAPKIYNGKIFTQSLTPWNKEPDYQKIPLPPKSL